MNKYVFGQSVELVATPRDSTSELPVLDAPLRLLLLGPAEASSSVVSLTNDGAGTYRAVVTPSTPGIWHYRFETTSGISAAEEGAFEVEPRLVPAPA